MTSDYYERGGTRMSDGSLSYATEEDRAHEQEVRTLIEQRWRCEVHSFGPWSPVDWWLSRDGAVVALAEVKSRSHASSTFDSVFLNLRKWLSLTLYAITFERPAFFIVRFTDCVRYIDLRSVGVRLCVGGCSKRVKGASDIEPVIEVPVADMRELKVDNQGAGNEQ